MTITDAMILPPDVVIVPVKELPASILKKLEFNIDDWAISRPQSRTPTRIINAELATLLMLFREERTIIEAVIEFAQQQQQDPEQTLEEAFPALQRFIKTQWLVSTESDSAAVEVIKPTLTIGTRVARFQVISCIQVLDDTELYQGQDENKRTVALKITRPNASVRVKQMFENEAKILSLLEGVPSPTLLDKGEYLDQKYIAIEWYSGVSVTAVAWEYQKFIHPEDYLKLHKLCCKVLDAYLLLHEKQVIHGDVHPNNILINEAGDVCLIDFGFSRILSDESPSTKVPRGGVADFAEPEFADARRNGQKPPVATLYGEQYSLAALFYLLFTGKNYQEFSIEKQEMLTQIVEASPISFATRGAKSWLDLERVLFKALSKAPHDRYPSMHQFAEELAKIKLPKANTTTTTKNPIKQEVFQQLVNTTLIRLRPEGNLFKDGLSEGPVASLTYGAAGIAYAIYRIACINGAPDLLSLADLWATKSEILTAEENAFCSPRLGITQEIIGQISPYHTISGVYAVQALIAHARGDFVSMCIAVKSFVEASNTFCKNLDVTLGRSGTLIACSLLLEALKGLPPVTGLESEREKEILRLGNQTLIDIWEHLRAYPPLAQCNELDHIGIAHGWGGLCYAALMWSEVSNTPVHDSIEERLRELAGIAELYGRGVRWPVRLQVRRPGATRVYMPSWCNGSPGQLHLWTMAYRQYGDFKYWELAEKAGWNTWEEKDNNGSICCGYAGRAYALLNLYKQTEDVIWLNRAHELCKRAIKTSKANPTMSNSLYKGELGVALLAADLMAPNNSCQPFFELETRSEQLLKPSLQ